MLLDYAKKELELAGYYDGSDMNKDMAECILSLIGMFSEQGHSGFSASFAIGLFERLARFEPLTPLTGADDEWTLVTDTLYQNKRCFTVFKEHGKAWNIDGKIFVEPNGGSYTNRDSFVDIEFPYVPTREYINVESREETEN